MVGIGKCTLDPVPPLRAGILDADTVQQLLVPGFVNWNPATGVPPHGAAGRFGFQHFRVRMRGSKVINETTKRIWESLESDGQINPVLLWARWDHIWISYGGSRAMWSYYRRKPLGALIVDHDDRFQDWREVDYQRITAEFREPPLGIVPVEFGWLNGEDFVLADAREWQFLSEKEREHRHEEIVNVPRKRGRPRKRPAAEAQSA